MTNQHTPLPNNDPADKPSAVRIYDYLLGGLSNFAADRAHQGIDQFSDIGAGIPTAGAVQEVGQRANPAARVVYVDRDPIAVHHGRAMLRDNPRATIVLADARQLERILTHPEVRHLLDLGRPLGVLLVALLYFVIDADAAHRVVRTLREAMAPGRYLVLSHGTDEGDPPDLRWQLTRPYASTADPATSRPRAAIARCFEAWESVEPGLVYIPQWRPDDPARLLRFAGAGRKP